MIPKKSQIIKNTQHPTYEEGFTFLVGEAWGECEAYIEVLEASTGKITCQYSFPEGSLFLWSKLKPEVHRYFLYICRWHVWYN